MPSPKRILAATDLSEAAAAVYEAAREYGRDAEVHLVHVFDPTPYVTPLAHPSVTLIDARLAKEIRATIERTLGELRERELPDIEHVETTAIRHHAAWAGLVDFAKANDIDLILVGSHGRTGIARMLLGSVAEKVVRHASCPVLVVRNTPTEKTPEKER